MIKTEVFGAEDAVVFTKTLNEFIKDKKIVDIKYQPILTPKEYRSGVLVRTSVLDRALVIYEED